jgi:hypothetical protein
MDIQVTSNTPLGDSHIDSTSVLNYWTCSFNKSQNLRATVKAVDESNLVVGFVQNIISSRKRAVYDSGITLDIYQKKLPVLDAKSENKPWFNSFAKVILKNVGEEANLFLTINPKTTVPLYITKKTSQKAESPIKRSLISLEVEESFLVSLYSNNENKIYRQWIWNYSYKVRPDKETAMADLHTTPFLLVADENGKFQPIVTDGPIAAENTVSWWSDDDWKPSS